MISHADHGVSSTRVAFPRNDLLLKQGAFRMAVQLHLFELSAVGSVFDGEEHEAPVILDSSRAELGLLELDAAEGFDGVDVELASSLAYVSGELCCEHIPL